MKYRRTAIGPFWITASTGLTILAISLVFSRLLGRTMAEFVPYGAAGIISWYFIASALNEGCSAIVSNASIYKSISAPYSYAIFRMLTRGLIVFAHNFLIFVVVAITFQINFLAAIPQFLLGLILVVINLGWMVTVLSVMTTRYRDIQQIIGALVTILFLITPIFWEKKAISATWIFQLNPFTYFIDAVRIPLIGGDGWGTACLLLCGFAFVGWTIAMFVFDYGHRRIIFWL
jgi:ABC-type polysaccharide/polyol phosphate export permease